MRKCELPFIVDGEGDMKSKSKIVLYFKKRTLWFLLIGLVVVITSCFVASLNIQRTSKSDEKESSLTLDDLKLIAKKGDSVSFEDFLPYDGQDIGSGLYIMSYQMESPYSVLVGGVPEEKPMYVELYDNKTQKHIDIRQENIEEFIHE